MSYRSRVYRQRNAQQNEHDQSKDQDKFFSSASEKSKSNGTKNAFFQAKSNDTTGVDDSLEKEADKTAEMASKDVKDNKEADKTAADTASKDVKDKKEETIQKLATPEEDKQTSTNDERQKNDKEKQV